MSYCRWSTDDFRCDLYCYEDVSGGFTTHVASYRVPDDTPHVTAGICDDGGEWLQQHTALMDFLGTAERTPIGLAHDGETFNDPDLASFRDRLVMLRAAGYRFPDDVFEMIAEEMASASVPPEGDATEVKHG